jgi:hypothetical protein
MQILKIHGRESTMVPIYLELTREAYERFADNFKKAASCQVQCKTQGKETHLDIWGSFIKKGMDEYMIQHLFAAMCLEAFIYDYAATNFSDTYASKYLDKLDLVSKWVVIPKLVLGLEFPRDGKEFSYIRNIKRKRDKLVHSKSGPELSQEQRDKELAKYNWRPSGRTDKDVDLPVNIFRQLVAVLKKLKELECESGKKQDWW